MISVTSHQPPIQPTSSISSAAAKTAATEESDGSERTETQSTELSAEDQQRLKELKARDREVRAHEQAHLAAAGGLAKGGASYTYERGPDQRMYAVGGEVQVDTTKVTNDPVATLRKAQTIRRAALAPANPSAQDRQAAAEASRMASEAQADITAAQSQGIQSDESSRTGDRLESKTETGCPACGGAHSSAAHDGMSAYASNNGSPSGTVFASA